MTKNEAVEPALHPPETRERTGEAEMKDWVRARTVAVGQRVRVKLPHKRSTPREGGIVREINAGGRVLVEPDFPDVDENDAFELWNCRLDQLLVQDP